MQYTITVRADINEVIANRSAVEETVAAWLNNPPAGVMVVNTGLNALAGEAWVVVETTDGDGCQTVSIWGQALIDHLQAAGILSARYTVTPPCSPSGVGGGGGGREAEIARWVAISLLAFLGFIILLLIIRAIL